MADVEPARVLLDGRVAEVGGLTLDAEGVIGGGLALEGREVGG